MIDVNNKSRSKIDLAVIKKTISQFLKLYKKSDAEVSVAIVGDKVMRELNLKYRKIDKTTDILSFSGEDNFLGELIINYQQIKRQAPKFSKNVKAELVFILIHGLLHLIGYSDQTESGSKEMDKLTKKVIKEIKY